MKINNDDIQMNKIMQAYQNLNKQNQQNVEQSKRSSDEVNISKQAKDIQKMQETLQSKPEIRQEKVAKIKNQVSNGTYQVNPQKIAEKIISNIE
ncbi:MAG TPA: flagellar biosynthesis anti-sigma factor FlgM [Halanaerobiales bacterium]|nr:flagellar biosynthesis anti-sigma factor FlgM [Halanaerobiales bacterium]